jgi:hypothetical protein
MRMKTYLWIVAVFLAFSSGMATGIYSVEKAEPNVVAPLVLDFCSLATNQDFLVGDRIQTTAEISLPLEGGVYCSAIPALSICLYLGCPTTIHAGRRLLQTIIAMAQEQTS